MSEISRGRCFCCKLYWWRLFLNMFANCVGLYCKHSCNFIITKKIVVIILLQIQPWMCAMWCYASQCKSIAAHHRLRFYAIFYKLPTKTCLFIFIIIFHPESWIVVCWCFIPGALTPRSRPSSRKSVREVRSRETINIRQNTAFPGWKRRRVRRTP